MSPRHENGLFHFHEMVRQAVEFEARDDRHA